MKETLFHTLAYPCARIRDFVYDYLEGDLPATVHLRFRVHLLGCKDCRGFLRLYRLAANPRVFREETPPPPEMLALTLRFLEAEGVLEGPPDGDRALSKPRATDRDGSSKKPDPDSNPESSNYS